MTFVRPAVMSPGHVNFFKHMHKSLYVCIVCTHTHTHTSLLCEVGSFGVPSVPDQAGTVNEEQAEYNDEEQESNEDYQEDGPSRQRERDCRGKKKPCQTSQRAVTTINHLQQHRTSAWLGSCVLMIIAGSHVTLTQH